MNQPVNPGTRKGEAIGPRSLRWCIVRLFVLYTLLMWLGGGHC